MDVEAAKMIGAGLAVIGLGGIGAGMANIFSSMIASGARNPSAIPSVQLYMWIGFALVEAVALYTLLIALLVLFG